MEYVDGEKDGKGVEKKEIGKNGEFEHLDEASP